MTKREFYKLQFSKIKTTGYSDSFICIGSNTVVGSLQLANLLDVLSDREPDSLLEEIELTINGGYYEEIYRIDGSSVDKVELMPPNAIINDDFTIALTDLKELLEGWIQFISNNS